MACRHLEVIILSANCLEDNHSSKMEVSAVVSVADDPHNRKQKKKTTVVKGSGTNPKFKSEPIKFTVDEGPLLHYLLTLKIKLVPESISGETKIGEVKIPLKELQDSMGGGDAQKKQIKHVSYSVLSPSGNPKGTITFGYKFEDKSSVPEPKSHERGKVYPVGHPGYPPASHAGAYPPDQAYPYPPPGEYPPLPHQQWGYGYAPLPQAGYGYPRQPGHGYQVVRDGLLIVNMLMDVGERVAYDAGLGGEHLRHGQRGYGYAPPPQAGYGYPLQHDGLLRQDMINDVGESSAYDAGQRGYGYAPPPQAGYGNPPQHDGLLRQDMINDVGESSAYDAGIGGGDFGGGFDDFGGYYDF